MTSRPTPRLNHRAAWSPQPNTRSGAVEAGEGVVCMACLSEKAESRRERRTDHCRGELLSCARMISIRFEGTVSAAVAAPLARLGKRRIGFDCSSVELYDLEAQAALGVAPDG